MKILAIASLIILSMAFSFVAAWCAENHHEVFAIANAVWALICLLGAGLTSDTIRETP